MKINKYFLSSDNPGEYIDELRSLNKTMKDVRFEDNFNYRNPYVLIEVKDNKKKKKNNKKIKYFIILPGLPNSKKYLIKDQSSGNIEFGSKNGIMENLNKGQVLFTIDEINSIDPLYLNFRKIAFNFKGEEIDYD